jgi:co-chaperonin GroES (HSP10)
MASKKSIECKIRPLSHRIIIEEREVIMKVGSIEMPGSIKDRSQQAMTEGKIICMAEDAFDFLPEGSKPQIGDIVHFVKYDGIGKTYDKKNYRILMDDSVWGLSKDFIELDEKIIDG